MRLGVAGYVSLCLTLLASYVCQGLKSQEIPAALEPWKNWVLWDQPHTKCPTPYHDSAEHICLWMSQLELDADPSAGSWRLDVRAFADAWMTLPGSSEQWPLDVQVDGQTVVLLERDGLPSVRLAAGQHRLTGKFLWDDIPQKLLLPKEIGILALRVSGKSIPTPQWDETGNVWLRRVQSGESERDQLTKQVFRILEDGIPLWLRTQILLTVSGKSREEELGSVLPEGWQLSLVNSPIPVAVDEQGRIKAQVRPGTWTIEIVAYRTNDLQELKFASTSTPVTEEELIAFKSATQLRVAELDNTQPIDVTQTAFPDPWRSYPVYQWDTTKSIRLIEKMRGMGVVRPEGLSIKRTLWLDDDGQSITFEDWLTGHAQQTWRLDVAEGHELGVVRIGDERQLITANPQTGNPGVEIRDRDPNLRALGRSPNARELAATGWRTSADSLSVTLLLPPGWRLLALFGADNVDGDWLTAWTLLDLFLLLLFAMSVYRLWGNLPGIIALVAFGLSYHEPGAPRLTWLLLLMPIAILRVVSEGNAKRWLNLWYLLSAAILMLNLIPFVAMQVQSAIYPQLETIGVPYAPRTMFTSSTYSQYSANDFNSDFSSLATSDFTRAAGKLNEPLAPSRQSNLQYDPKTSIQTGPARPEWYGNQVRLSWNGPVSSEQTIQPILLSRNAHRWLTLARLLCLSLLIVILFKPKAFRFRLPWLAAKHASVVMIAAGILGFVPDRVQAQFPDPKLLDQLRERLLRPSDAYPEAASIPSAALRIDQQRLSMTVDIHAAIETAVPLPGRLPIWSPLSVALDGQPNAVIGRRDDGYLWVVVPQGVHQVTIEGMVENATEWVLNFVLAPHRLSVEAPGWNVTGLGANGHPENQLFFVRANQSTVAEASYDQRSFRAVAAVERTLEIGLTWKINSKVTRLSNLGKAVAIRVPLLAGERVLSSSPVLREGELEVKLAADQEFATWESELDPVSEIELTASQSDQFVEQWLVNSSPVWNCTTTGLAPTFRLSDQQLIPAWYPWPGEQVKLNFVKPDATSGETLTIQRLEHSINLGSRQRDVQLKIDVESSLGNDFTLDLEKDYEVTELQVNGKPMPVRRNDKQLIIPLPPGAQQIICRWKTSEPMSSYVISDAIQSPINNANITTIVEVPESRWILWTSGPMRGPAVRFWVILTIAVLLAFILGRLPLSPLNSLQWILLLIGLTQVNVFAALIVVGWMFVWSWRGTMQTETWRPWRFNLLQIALVFLTLSVLSIFIFIVGEGLLGSPEMFILGNQSYAGTLRWFQPTSDTTIPRTVVISVSIWWYRFLMLLWALWLATALIRWLERAWTAFSQGGRWKRVFAKLAQSP